MPCIVSRAQQEKERLLFFPGKASLNKRPWTFCLLQLPFALLPLCGDLHKAYQYADPELQFSANVEYSHFCWKNVWQSIYFRSTFW